MKKLKIVGIVFLALILVLGGLAIWQKDNIVSLCQSFQYSEVELEQKINDSKTNVQQALDQYTSGAIRDFTVEEEALIQKGELTPEEAIQKILTQEEGQVRNPSDENSTGQASDKNQDKPKQEDPVTAIINSHVAKVYEIKARFLSQLGGLENKVIAAYEALPKEKHNATGKSEIMSQYMGEAIALESTCDSEVNAVLSSLESQLKAQGADIQIVKTIRSSYIEQKNLKKSFYMSKYM